MRLDNRQAFIQLLIEQKLADVKALPHGPLAGRRLQLAFDTEQAYDAAMTKLFQDIAERVGLDVFHRTPAVVLEQFCIVSVQRNEDTAGLLVSLLNSFMLAYLTPELSARAYAHLEGLEGLRKELGASRSQGVRH